MSSFEFSAETVEHIILDCHAVAYMDSYGLGTMVSALKQISARSGTVSLARPRESILRLTGLDQLFTVTESVADARKAVGLAPAG